MTAVGAVALVALLAAIAWVLLTPLVARGRIEGSLDDGAHVEVELRFVPLSARLRAEPGTPLRMDLAVAGMPLPWPRSRSRGTPATSRPARLARVHRRRPLGDLMAFLVRHRHDVVVRVLEGRVRYGCEDPALTGQLHGAICTARPLFDPQARVAVLPDWSMRDVLAGHLLGEIRVFAGRLAVAFAVFLLTTRRRAT